MTERALTSQRTATAPVVLSKDKHPISRAFAKAAKTYDDYAQLQQQVAEVGLQQIQVKSASFKSTSFQSERFKHILDLGCGTGMMLPVLKALLGKDGRLLAVDFAPEMLIEAKKRCEAFTSEVLTSETLISEVSAGIEYYAMDAEQLSFADAQFDLIYSNLMLQWCDPHKVLSAVRRLLTESGVAWLSTLVAGSLLELQQSFASFHQQQHVNRFLTPIELTELAAIHGFGVSFEQRKMFYPDLRTLLMGLKGVGANWVQTESRTPMTKTAWLALNQAYESWRTPEGLPLTYQLAYLQFG